ncbi:MAG: aminotransferase class V-fold PLP-dependent enzyme [Aquirufa sp.]
MLSFYPGPSKVHPEALEFIQEAFDQGIVSINHRSARFEALLKDTLEVLHAKWNIPSNYTIYFVSSATEAWEIIAQSLIEKQSLHLYNGAFGKKWAHYTQQIYPQAQSISFDAQARLSSVDLPSLAEIDTICLVQSETSNGTGQTIARSLYGERLIAVDATSSMGGIELPWNEADVWLASVQKCLGIPAGLGIMICSPKALARAEKLGRKSHYNDILLMEENRKRFQTHYTPNVLSIYVLNRLTHLLPNLSVIDAQTRKKMEIWEHFWLTNTNWGLQCLIENPELRLPTVLALQGDPEQIQLIQQTCLAAGIELGKGYGDWQANTVRIANFPSHTENDIQTLIQVLTHEL